MGEGGDEAAARAARRILGAEAGRWAQQRAGAPAVDGSFFSKLLAGARALAWRAWEPSTRASRTSAVQQWFVFIYLLGVSGYMLDVTQRPPEAVLVAYLYWLYECAVPFRRTETGGLRASTCRKYAEALCGYYRMEHGILDLAKGVARWNEILTAMEKDERDRGIQGKRWRVLTVDLLAALVLRAWDFTKRGGKCDRWRNRNFAVLVVTAFAFAMRIGECTASRFSSDLRLLQWRNVKFYTKDHEEIPWGELRVSKASVHWVEIEWQQSKMDSKARGAFRAHERCNSALCVVAALLLHALWAQDAGLTESTCVFVVWRGGKAVAFPTSSVNSVMRAHLASDDILGSTEEAAQFSGHQSLRGGAETAMLHSGFPAEVASFLSRRKAGSDSRKAYLAYARSLMAGKQAQMLKPLEQRELMAR